MEQQIPPPPVKEAKIKGPYIRADLNPSPLRLQEILAGAQRTLLEIGCGENPRISWRLTRGDTWIGTDPAIRENGQSILVHKGDIPISVDAKLAVFSDIVADIPKFQPEVLVAVAPNQRDIVEGKIFDDGLEGFLSSKKKQTLIIVLDTRSREASVYQDRAINVIRQWVKENSFKLVPKREADTRGFSPNSADLGESNISMTFVRRP